MDSKKASSTNGQRKGYKKPILTKYGKLKELTTGGTSGVAEGGSSSKNKKA